MGGINTLSFIQSSEAEIIAEARACIRDGVVDDRRFILGSGCVVPRDASKEILQVLSAVAKSGDHF